VSVAVIEDGYEFRVLVLDDMWVVRIPRREACAEMLAIEAVLLPALAPTLPVRVPEFVYAAEVAVYRLIDGSPLVGEEDGVREFLAALHAFDVGDLPVPRPDWLETYRRQCEAFRRLVLPLLDVDERDRAEALFAEVETLTGFEPVLTHSDLGPEHLLCRDGKLVGVIDWGDTRIGDPALDYAWLLNGPFPRWDVDDDLRGRSRIYHRLVPWFEAHYGVFTGQPARTERAVAAIRTRL
jgi:aminoglycoside phosphotransferase (APT) family kinase protein